MKRGADGIWRTVGGIAVGPSQQRELDLEQEGRTVADHINISAPRARGEIDDRVQAARMKAELSVLQAHYDDLQRDLDSIFTRIARGDQVELHYPDGKVILITKAKPRNAAGE